MRPFAGFIVSGQHLLAMGVSAPRIHTAYPGQLVQIFGRWKPSAANEGLAVRLDAGLRVLSG